MNVLPKLGCRTIHSSLGMGYQISLLANIYSRDKYNSYFGKHKLIYLMLCLFEHKIFSEKYFRYFLVFGATENESQRKSF
jgi:hypothetical protein